MKQKFEKKLITDIVGVLDKKDGKIIISVDGVEYDFIEDVLKDSFGTEIRFKSESEEEE